MIYGFVLVVLVLVSASLDSILGFSCDNFVLMLILRKRCLYWNRLNTIDINLERSCCCYIYN